MTLVALLRRRAEEGAGRGYTFLTDGEREEETLSWEELDRRARSLGALLRRHGLRGERVLLVYPAGLEYIVGFFGCLYAGAVAVPTYPPRPNRGADRLGALARDARPRAVLTTSGLLARLGDRVRQAPDLQDLPWIATDEPGPDLSAEWEDPGAGPETLAFLQYTSGSTSSPKGVMVTHGNLVHNEEMIGRAFGQGRDSVVVGWLPLYHDMGLIGNVLQPLAAGSRCVLLSPVSFLQQPARWLRAIARYRGTTSGGPDFAYDLCVRKIDAAQRAGLDLSCWTLAFSGAEPVRAITLERFAEAFAPCGFRPEAFYPCYGLAEATLFVAGGEPGAAPTFQLLPDGRGNRLVGCGHAWADQRIAIVDPETSRLVVPGSVGEIWVAGPSVAQGYWGRPEVTRETFQARLDSGEGPFLRTGDLGFLHDGALYVTGRLKDLIILRGRNLYPQDVEATVERSHPDLRPGSGAAFSVEVDGEERLVVVNEVERRADADLEEVAAAVRRAVAEEHEAQVHAVVFLRVATIPKTSSGKIQRHACRAGYLAGTLTVVGSSVAGPREEIAAEPEEPRREDLLRWLCARIAARARVSAVDPDRPLLESGLDSLGMVELRNDLEIALGVAPPLSALLEEATPERLARDLLALLDKGEMEAEPMAPGEEAPEGPLSWGQKGLWIEERLAPDSAVYNLAAAARVRSGLDVPALRRALEALARRHRSLRATFAPGPNGEPVQRWAEAIEIPLVEEDASAWSDEALAARLDEEACRPFDLERGPLWRVAVLRCSPGEDVLSFVFHHLIVDFWSAVVLARDLGAPAGLEPLAVDYADAVRWQEQRLAGPRGEELREGWRALLASAVPPLELPADRPRPARPSHRGGAGHALWNAGLAGRARSLAASRGTTLFTVLLAAFQAYLHRVTGSDRVRVGSPTSGRSSAWLADLAGYFVNPVVLEADLAGDPSFGELVDRVRRAALAAFDLQDYPFPLLVEELQPARDADHPPFFSVMFVFQRAHLPEMDGLAALALGTEGARLDLGGLVLEPLRQEPRRARFPWTLTAAEVDGGIAASLQFAADLFDRATIERVLAHLESLLRSAVEEPERRISELELLSDGERQQVLREWNATAVDYPRESCLRELFAAVAERYPEAPAVIGSDERLSYRELDERSTQLAWELREAGVGLEETVGLCVERSAGAIVGILGILKAGGAYVPLDPSLPLERLAWMARDAGVRVVVTAGHPAGEALGLTTAIPTVETPRGASPAAAVTPEEGDAPRGVSTVGGQADQLAYVLYTSGSTGRPKGVAVTHRNVVRLIEGGDSADFEAGDVVSQIAPLFFDVSTLEIWGALLKGGCLVVPPPGPLVIEELGRFIAESRMTVVWLPAGLFHEMVDGALSSLAGVRQLVAGGDVLSPAHVRRALAALPDTMLINGYGPTENTTFTCCHRMRPGDRIEGSVPLGRPIVNTTVHVLDDAFAPLPIGVWGELCTGGDGVARGYLNRPELTAERFVPDPWGAPGSRLYRTGDVARWLPDGLVEFAGRRDQQVKIRGFRIELGEIESVLARHPSVRDAAILARRSAGGDLRLVAYVVPAVPVSEAELRAWLGERLPAWMVPAAWVELESLPLTANGKLDRRALPEPARAESSREPRTATERRVAEIFAAVLGLEGVGAEEDFFALGGHSLKGTQVVSRLREAFGVEVPLRRLFEAPTVAGLAALVDAETGPARVPPLRRYSKEGDLPLSFAQERLWLVDQLAPGGSAYNIAAAVRLRGRIDPALLEASLGEIVRRHEALRTVFAAPGGRPCQRIEPAGVWHLPVLDLSKPEAESHARELARQPFDLARGPLLRTALLRTGSDEGVLVLVMHHIVSDGWSLGVLARELRALYGTSPLPELPVQYADFALWQREWLAGAELERQLGYWREKLRDMPVLELPADRPRPAEPTEHGGRLESALDAELTAKLESLGRHREATPFMVLLAAFLTLLGRIADRTDLAVGAPVANRERPELEGLIGFFVNTLVLRADLAGEPTFLDLLAQVRETALEAFAHKDLPFEELVTALRPIRGHDPLFQVLFAFQNAPPPDLDLPGLELEAGEIDTGLVRFDLSLGLTRAGEELQAVLRYRADLYDPSTAERLLGHFRSLLEGIAADPDQRISDLPLLTPAELRQILAEGRGEHREELTEGLLHTAFEQQARRVPQNIAVLFEGESLTYGELDGRATRLAARLRRLGAGPESRVAICLERSLDLIVSLLGVLKAGAAYVPLDPAHPIERLRMLWEDSGAEILLAPAGAADLGIPAERTVDPGEEVSPSPGGGEGGRWERGPGGEDSARDRLAYVMYTSGTTGRPKGVMVPHRGVVNHLRWRQSEYSLGESDVLLHKAPLGFDASVWEILWPLSVGARLVVARPGGHQDVAYLVDLVRREKVTFLHAVPSLLRVLVEEPGLADCTFLRRVTTGGEPLPVDVREKFFSVLQAELLHGYGPTEASIGVTYGPCERGSGEATTLGRPIANTEILLLDRSLIPVPVGVPAELCIGGAALARGYLGRPDLTAERFVPNPYSAEPGSRLYRSGDLVRRRPDGGLEFLGRIDHQIKIRGMRVEPAEIEAALESHPDVREAAVLLRDERLIAYVVANPESRIENPKSFLASRLPPHMVPSAFVALDALPLMASGKIDRLALERLEPGLKSVAERAFVAPRNPVEEKLAEIWRGVLGVERVGAEDDFFELGGHSLLAVQVVSRIRESFEMELPVRVLFASPTLAQLADAVESLRWARQAQPPAEAPPDADFEELEF